MKATLVNDLVEANGKTWKENNLDIQHNIPVGKQVRAKIDMTGIRDTFIKGEAVLFVKSHDRDCDGTPLYTLSWTPPAAAWEILQYARPDLSESEKRDLYERKKKEFEELDRIFGDSNMFSGYTEQDLKLIE